MSKTLETSINEICQAFCKQYEYEDCVEIGKGMHSIVFKACEKKTKYLVCFKIIPETEFNKSKEEWNVLKLLNKFIIIM
jgi:predicted Ser/Thr protein kinase